MNLIRNLLLTKPWVIYLLVGALLLTGAMVGVVTVVKTTVTGPTVNLNDYVTITASGYEGYGKLEVKVDTEKLVEDHAKHLTDKNLDTQYFGNKTPELAANFVFTAYNPYKLAYNAGENLKNGDKIDFSWNTSESAIETLKNILKVDIKYKNFTYTVKGLEELEECDPFENINIKYTGYSGGAYISTYTEQTVSTTVRGEVVHFPVRASKTTKIANGDTIHLSLEKPLSYYTSEYGIIPTRTDADIVVENIDYLAVENPQGVLSNITETSQQNIITTLNGLFKEYGWEMKYEYIGAICFYEDDYPLSNQLRLIYHVDNGVDPDGWYIYLYPKYGAAYVRHIEQEDGTILKSTSIDVSFEGSYDALPADISNYNYHAVETLEECLADTSDIYYKHSYDHVVGTDSLRDYFEEY